MHIALEFVKIKPWNILHYQHTARCSRWLFQISIKLQVGIQFRLDKQQRMSC